MAEAPLPLDAELGRLVAGHLDDQAFDEYLRPAHVELVDHGTQVPVDYVGGDDDQRIGRRVGLDLRAADLSGDRRLPRADARERARGRAADRARAVLLLLALECGLLHLRLRASLVYRRRDAEKRAREIGRIGVLEIDDVDVARRAGRLVEARYQCAHELR